MTFRERFMRGEADFEEIFVLTDEWNYGEDPRTLREYLGLNAEEEDVWISESDDALEELMNQERRTLKELADQECKTLEAKKNE